MKNIEKNYIVVQGYMVQKLNLKGNELLAFSLINGFSQDFESEFSGSIDYIATWLNSSKQTVITVMNTLVEKELVFKKQICINNVTFNRYTVNHAKVTEFIGSQEIRQGVKELDKGSNILNSSQEIRQGVKELDKGSQNFRQGGSQNFRHNNIQDKIIDKIKDITHSENASESVTCFSFQEFFDTYNKKKDRKRAEVIYNKLSEKDRQAIKDTIHQYVALHSDPQYRKHPTTYLNGRNWEDDLTDFSKTNNIANPNNPNNPNNTNQDDHDQFGYA